MPSPVFRSFRELLERCAIPGLIRYVVIFNALVFILQLLAPGFISLLQLNPQLVLEGEIWRLVTWIFVPETTSMLWIAIALFFLYSIGDGLEEAIGSSKLTLYYFSGMLVCTIVAFAFALSGSGVVFTGANIFLNLSLMLAYATIYPDVEILVLFVIPMRIAWVAVLSSLFMIFSTLGQPPVVMITLAATFMNYFLFFHHELRSWLSSFNPGKNSSPRSEIFKKTSQEIVETLHRCESCGRTEISHPDLDFRVTATGHEYCTEHLKK